MVPSVIGKGRISFKVDNDWEYHSDGTADVADPREQ